MNKAKKLVKKVIKQLGLDITEIDEFEGRYVATDKFTTILVAKAGTNIKLWATSHKNYMAKAWKNRENKSYEPNSDYARGVTDKLKMVSREPEVDIIFDEVYDDFEVVVYTDTLDALVYEAINNLKEGL